MIRTRMTIASTLLGALLVFPAAAAAQTKPEVALRAALETETVKGDLRGAIEQYKKIAQGPDRALAAKALLRIAECHEKLGNSEARNYYDKIVRDFSDQRDIAAIAKERLGVTGATGGSIVTRQIWSGPGVQLWGSVSDDGRLISFVDRTSGHLMIHDVATGKDRRVTDGQGAGATDFSIFSPNGKQIAYVWFPGVTNALDGRSVELRLIGVNGNSPSTHRVLYANPDVRYPGPWDWSLDGKWIVLQIQRADRTVQIALLSTADGSVRVLKSAGWGAAQNMAFSPDGRFLAYGLPSREDSRNCDVYIIATDGSRENALIADPHYDDKPLAWTPDGKYLLFKSDRGDVPGIWAQPVQDGKPHGAPKLVRAGVDNMMGLSRSGTLFYGEWSVGRELYTASMDWNTGSLRSAPASEFLGGYPGVWSPDGKLLAYGMKSAAPARFSRIRIRDIASGQTRELQPKLRYLSGFCFLAGGESFVAAGSDLKGRHGIFRLDARTGDAEMIEPAGNVRRTFRADLALQPKCASGGNKVFYARFEAAPGADVAWLVKWMEWDPSSKAQREWLTIDLRTSHPLGIVPSPDGSQLAYGILSDATNRSTLFVLPSAGGEPRQLDTADRPRFELSGWTPDGRSLIVRKTLSPNGEGEPWLVPISGAEPRRLGIPETSAHAISISPDGQRVAYTVERTKTRAVVAMENFLPSLEADKGASR